MTKKKQADVKKKTSHQSSMKIKQKGINSWLDMNIVLPALLIAVLTFIAYLSALGNGFTNWDDQVYVYQNPLLKDLSLQGLKALMAMNLGGNHHPLTMLSLALNYSISGLAPYSYHLFNVILHVVNSLLVFYFIYILTGLKMEVAFVCGLLFGIHPMHVESVAWVSARKDVLYTMFFVGGLITYIFYIKSMKMKWLLITGLLFILSLLSKPAAIIFPLVLLLVDYFLERKIKARAILEKIPFLIFSVFFGILTLVTQFSVGAISDKPVFTVFQKMLFGSYSTLMYLIEAVVPYKLSAYHPYPYLNEMPVIFYMAPLIILAIIAMVVIFFRRNRMIVFGLLFFVVNLLLILQFVSVGNAIMADRYTYVPYIGLFFILGSGLSYVLRSRRENVKKYGAIAMTVFLLFSAVFSYATYNRNKVWKGSESLWGDVSEKYPWHTLGWYNRGQYLSSAQQYEKAISDYSNALALKPNYYEALYNRAQAYRLTGKSEMAIEDYKRAMTVKPTEVNPQKNIGLAYFNLKKYDMALIEYNKAVKNFPDNYDLWYGKGNSYYYLKDYRSAIENYTKAIELNPKYADAWYNRAVAYGHLLDKKNAKTDMLKAQELGYATDTTFMNWLKK